MAESEWDILAPTSDTSEDSSFAIITSQELQDSEENKLKPIKQVTSHTAELFTNLRFHLLSGQKVKITTKLPYIVMLGMCYTNYGADSKFDEGRTIRRFNI